MDVGSDAWWDRVRELGVDRRRVERTLDLAAGGSGRATIDPHDLDPTGSPAELAVTYLLLFRDVPTYATVLHVSHSWDCGGAALQEWIVDQYAAYIDGGDDRHRDEALYSLWVDFFEVPERAVLVFPRLLAAVTRRADLLAHSGPVPWSVKQAAYREAARDEHLHAGLAAGLLGSFFDVYGSVEPVEARALFHSIRVDDPQRRAALERVTTEPRRWRVLAVVGVDEADERWRTHLSSAEPREPSFLMLLATLDVRPSWVPASELFHDDRLLGRLVHWGFPFDPAIRHEVHGSLDGHDAHLFRVEGDLSVARHAVGHEVAAWPRGLALSERRAPLPQMGKIDDMRKQREAAYAKDQPGGAAAAASEPAAEVDPDATEGKCAACGKVKELRNGLVASHQKGLGKFCAGSNKAPV